MADKPAPTTFYGEPRSIAADLVRHALAFLVVLGCVAGGVYLFRPAHDSLGASELESAVLVDLSPAAASSQSPPVAEDDVPRPDVNGAPAQTAASSVPPTEAAGLPEPPQVSGDTAADRKAPDHSEVKTEQALPPAPPAAPPAPSQQATAPPSSSTPDATEVEGDEAEQAHASAHAITLWQKSLLRRLEAAKRLVDPGLHGGGTVRVTFAIDAKGALSAERIETSSGSPALDRAALRIIDKAAPFPAPPQRTRAKDTVFVVPIRFR